MRKTETGVWNLNRELQDALNPARPSVPEIRIGETVFREGDKVMQIKNNYTAGVFNGDVGIIVKIDLQAGRKRPGQEDAGEDDEDDGDLIHVEYPSGRVLYDPEDLDQLVLAYASTIHKSQGSEYGGTVFIALARQHWRMLQRNLLYTAITRARKRVVLVGQIPAIRQAVENVSASRRHSRLAERLRTAIAAADVRRLRTSRTPGPADRGRPGGAGGIPNAPRPRG